MEIMHTGKRMYHLEAALEASKNNRSQHFLRDSSEERHELVWEMQECQVIQWAEPCKICGLRSCFSSNFTLCGDSKAIPPKTCPQNNRGSPFTVYLFFNYLGCEVCHWFFLKYFENFKSTAGCLPGGVRLGFEPGGFGQECWQIVYMLSNSVPCSTDYYY